MAALMGLPLIPYLLEPWSDGHVGGSLPTFTSADNVGETQSFCPSSARVQRSDGPGVDLWPARCFLPPVPASRFSLAEMWLSLPLRHAR